MTGPAPLRLAAQLLAGEKAAGVAAAARHLLAIQAQDPRGARLAVRARTAGLTAGDVDCALTDERSVVIGWLNRGTLHLVPSEDYMWLHSLTAPRLFTANARRLEQEGVGAAAAERGVAAIEKALADEGPLTRAELRDRVAGAGVRTEGQALVHVLMLASLRGLAVRGPMRGREHAHVLVRDWLPRPGAIDRDAALAELARRFLAGHGPAGERDLAKWSGLTLDDARRGLSAIAPELTERPDGLVDLARRGPAGEARPVLLGVFDPLMHGWVSREPVLGAYEDRVIGGGMFKQFALVRGEAAALWRIDGGEVLIEPLRDLRPAERRALEGDAADVRRFLFT